VGVKEGDWVALGMGVMVWLGVVLAETGSEGLGVIVTGIVAVVELLGEHAVNNMINISKNMRLEYLCVIDWIQKEFLKLYLITKLGLLETAVPKSR
jgi:hypothetical protein